MRREVVGPGRYPVESAADKSVGLAILLGALFGPAGICYMSVTAGLIAIGVAAVALIVFGFVSLAVLWPLSLAVAVISALVRHRRYARQ